MLGEDEMELTHEVRDSLVMKLPIKKFGKKSRKIQDLYPEAKVLVFCTEPWHVTGMNAACINENILYVLAKWRKEYVIVAEKRLAELEMRTGSKFKKLLTFNGDTIDELVLYHPFTERDIPILIKNDVTSSRGTGVECIAPAHDLESLKVAYHYGLSKEGYVD